MEELSMTKRERVERAVQICEENEKLFEQLGISSFNRVYNDVKKTLYATILQDEYGLIIVSPSMVNCVEPNVYVRINNHMYIASMGEKYGRKISWPVDGKQPIDEIMLVISFPTGAYIFGDSRPKELFERLRDELKQYGAKYVDDMNHNLYYPLETASNVANNFDSIKRKYHQIFRDEADQRRAIELRRELEKLEGKAVRKD